MTRLRSGIEQRHSGGLEWLGGYRRKAYPEDMQVVFEGILYRPMVVIADRLGDGQSQSVAFLPVYGMVEPLEEMFVVQGLPLGGIGNAQLVTVNGDEYLSARFVMPDGIYDEIVDEAFCQYLITLHFSLPVVDLCSDVYALSE